MCKRSSRATRTGKARRSSSASSATSSQPLRADSLTRNQAHALLVEAEKRLTGLVSLPRALRVAEQFGVSAYDARFLGAAQSFKTRLMTEDARLRKAAPALTISLSDVLAA